MVNPFNGRPLIVDTSLCVLLSVGLANPDYIGRHKRLAHYDATDFQLLCEIVKAARNVVITPNVASETSNLVRQIGSPIREAVAATLAALILHADEHYVESRSAVRDRSYVRLGVTDSVLLMALGMRKDATLLTSDHDLHVAAQTRKLAVVNFNHIRNERYDFR